MNWFDKGESPNLAILPDYFQKDSGILKASSFVNTKLGSADKADYSLECCLAAAETILFPFLRSSQSL